MDFKTSYISKKSIFKIFYNVKFDNQCTIMNAYWWVLLFSSIVDKIIFVYNLLYLHPVSRPFPVLNNKCKNSPKVF
jgi:hypothetical protein